MDKKAKSSVGKLSITILHIKSFTIIFSIIFFLGEFKQLVGKTIPYQQLGFVSLHGFLMALSDVVKSIWLVYLHTLIKHQNSLLRTFVSCSRSGDRSLTCNYCPMSLTCVPGN